MIRRFSMPDWLRARLPYLTAAILTVAIGLAVHLHGSALGSVARDVIGDALWAVMMCWWVAAVAPELGLRIRSAVALGICFAVELGQLYHGPTVDALRHLTAGHLLIGSGFDPRGLGSYTLGVLAAAMLDRSIRGRDRQHDTQTTTASIT